MLTVRCNRATTLDHLKPTNREEVRSLRSLTLIPACRKPVTTQKALTELVSSGSKSRSFTTKLPKNLIEEWISNKRFIEEELDERAVVNRTEVCTIKGDDTKSAG